jgi:uncharacterized Zn finger protein (UPF0148 family)
MPLWIGQKIMHTQCIYCHADVVQAKNREGPNFCPVCQRLFEVPEEPKLKPWILGILVILVANLQILCQ